MRCDACGATNPDTAAWCGQCYRRFDEPDPEPEPEAPSAVSSADAPTNAAVPPSQPVGSAAQGFRRDGEGLQWECPECNSYNPLELQRCAVCGTSFVERFRSDEPEPPRNWSQALLLSAVAPGAGHLAVGRYGSGWARLLLFCVWVAGAVLLTSAGGSRAVVVAAPLLLGAVVLWGGTLVDIYRLQQGDNELLAGRTFLWLVVGVLLLLGVSLFASMGSPPAS